ncbi:hypothetical protein ACQ86O_20260 [Serratia sp. L9]|uniref:hypothetical protein n=1 Tax=Serratia sp. L9 TaxID=3423946 RepID=UPI003D666605
MAIGGALAGFDQLLEANVAADKARLPALIKDQEIVKSIVSKSNGAITPSSIRFKD